MNLADFWFSSAAKALAPYLFAAVRSERSIDDVARWIEREERSQVLAILRGLDADAALAHEATHRSEDRARSALFQVMQEILDAYEDPAVAKSAERNDIVATDLLDGNPNTLYVASPHHDQARLRPLFSTLIGQVLTAVHEQFAATNTALDPPLLLVLDEAANIAPLDGLPTVASTGAAMGLQLVTVFQDQAQIRERYGQSTGTIVNNHRAKLVLPGVSDVDTLELVSRLAGDEEIDRDSVSRDHGGRRSATTSTQWRRLLPPELARQLRDGKGILLYGNLPPAQIQLRPWYRNHALRARATVALGDREPGRPPPQARAPASPHGNGHPRPDRAIENAEPDVAPNTTVLDAARARLRHPPPAPSPGGDS